MTNKKNDEEEGILPIIDSSALSGDHLSRNQNPEAEFIGRRDSFLKKSLGAAVLIALLGYGGWKYRKEAKEYFGLNQQLTATTANLQLEADSAKSEAENFKDKFGKKKDEAETYRNALSTTFAKVEELSNTLTIERKENEKKMRQFILSYFKHGSEYKPENVETKIYDITRGTRSSNNLYLKLVTLETGKVRDVTKDKDCFARGKELERIAEDLESMFSYEGLRKSLIEGEITEALLKGNSEALVLATKDKNGNYAHRSLTNEDARDTIKDLDSMIYRIK